MQSWYVRLMTLLMAVVAMAVPARAANHIQASLVAQSSTPAANRAITVAVVFKPEPGWHGYWQNPGDAGFGTKFEWKLPAGITAGPPQYPVPQRLLIAGLMNHVFEQEYALLIQMKIPRGLANGTALPIRVHGDWLACTDKICVPEGGDLSLDLKIGDGAITPEAQAKFDGWWAKLPRPLEMAGAFQVDGKALRISIPYPENAKAVDPWFYAISENALNYAAPQKVTRQGDRLVIETVSAGKVDALEGVLAIGPGMGLAVHASPGVVAAGGDSASSSGLFMTILLALGGAILGGLILNVMPCVFPIISLKALSLARAGGDESAAKREALAYAGGVIITCLALGGLLLGLRAGGAQIGWAFQLQDPRVIFLLLLLATAITLNLAGVFHLRGFGGGDKLASQGGAAGSFWTGVLAAFVATPCTGPFMAAALGAALVLPTLAALAIFAGLGLGLALPFLALGFIPALRRMMPKPGTWMVTFQRWLAVPMALTVAALVWLLWKQFGLNGLLLGGAAIALVAIATRVPVKFKWLPIAGLAASLAYVTMIPKVAEQGSRWIVSFSFDEEMLAMQRQRGAPVFLYFTADWCLTCKVNEKAAIEREEVQNAFERAHVVTMVGDWTNGDPAISRFLESQGRSGVPLYLFYPEGGGEPQQLPQVLTVGTLTALAK